MRVCFLAPEFLPNQGGVGTYSVELAKRLADFVDLTVLAPAREGNGAPITREEMERILGNRASVRIVSKANGSFLYNASFQIAVLCWLKRLMRRGKFDIIHSQHAHMPDLLHHMVDSATARVVTVHSTIRGQRMAIRTAQSLGDRLETHDKWQLALAPLLQTAEWLTLDADSHFITVSQWMKGQLVERGIPVDRVHVVHPGVDANRFRPGAGIGVPLPFPRDRPVVLFSGRPTLAKGLATVIRAIPLITKETPNVHFVFLGAEPDSLMEMRARLAADGASATFVKSTSYDDPRLPAMYASAFVGILPSFLENLPLRALEMMACAVPLVASGICGLPEVIRDGENGLLVPPGFPARLAHAIVSLIEDPGLRDRMGQNARKTVVERFSWEKSAEETFKVYQNVLAAGS